MAMSHPFKQVYTALEAAQVLINDWSDDDDKNEVELVIFSPEQVDALTSMMNWMKMRTDWVRFD